MIRILGRMVHDKGLPYFIFLNIPLFNFADGIVGLNVGDPS